MLFMAHRCVRCGKIYNSTAPEILKGCSCGSHYFFFFRDEDIKLKEETEKLTREEREEIMQDIKEIIGVEVEKPVILDLESIRITKPGKFEIDLVSLFKRKPVIYKVAEGKYIIDIPSTFHFTMKKE
ncbi:MAG: Zn-ribbon containing protein [Candidatus Pacearchaeota archaeon]